jgi:hypothetical protein
MDSGGWESSNLPWEDRPLSRLNSPGFFVFSAIILMITKIPELIYFRFWPLLCSIFFSLCFYLFETKVIKEKIIQKFGIIAFLFSNLWLLFHPSPQALGLLFFPLILIILPLKTLKCRVVVIILFLALLITHLITTLFLIAILTAMNAILWIARKKSYEMTLLWFFGISFIAYFVFYATLYFDANIQLAFQGLINSQFGGSMGYIVSKTISLPSIIRLATIIITSIMAIMYTFYIRKDFNKFAFSAGWIIAGFSLLLINLVLQSGGIYNNRFLAFLFLLVPLLMVQFVLEHKSIKKYKNFIIMAVFLLLLANVSTIYYLENNYIISNSCIAHALFLVRTRPQFALVIGTRLNVWYSYNVTGYFL